MYVLVRVIAKEFLQLLRDKTIVPMVLVAPAFQIVVMGYAANLDVTNVPTILVDLDRTAASRAFADRFLASGYFELAGTEDRVAAVEEWFVQERARIALVVDRGFGRAVASGRSPRVQLLADGTDSSATAIGLSYATGIVAELGTSAARTGPERALRRNGSIRAVPRVWYNPDLRSRWFFVPAILAIILMVLTLVLSSMGVVREKEIGTMEQVMVTPIRPWQLMVGKLFPFATIGLVDVFIVTGLTVGWFGVPLRGSFLLLVFLTLLFLLNTLGLGLLTSTVVRTQQQAVMTASFVIMVPQIYLSGLLFPIENMPRLFQLVSYAIPLRYYARILRSLFLKGSDLTTLWPDALLLTLFGVTLLSLAALRFRKTLD